MFTDEYAPEKTKILIFGNVKVIGNIKMNNINGFILNELYDRYLNHQNNIKFSEIIGKLQNFYLKISCI